MNIHSGSLETDSRHSERVAKFFDDYNNKSTTAPAVPAPPAAEANTQMNDRMKSIKEKTRYVDTDGVLLSNTQINKKIIEKIKGIYSVDSVTVNKTEFEFGGSIEKRVARKIQIVRTWCFYDLVPLGVFLPTLCNRNSVYHKTINTNSIQDFLLNARPKKNEIKIIMAKLQTSFPTFSQPEREQMNELIERKYDDDVDTYEISDTDRVGKSTPFLTKFQRYIQAFKNEYEMITLEGRNHLITAYWKSKSLTIYIPEDIQDNNLEAYIEVPKDSGMTPIAINMAISLRNLAGC